MISVIVPVYNTPEKYIKQCVNSILDQTYQDIQLLLIDDGSKKTCAEFLDTFGEKDQRCKVIHTLNKGVSSARNTGIENSDGEYITFVDSDDWIEKDCLEQLLKSIGSFDMAIIGYEKYNFDQIKFNAASNPPFIQTCTNRDYIIDSILGYTSDALNWMLNSVWGKLYKRSVIFQQGAVFDTNLKRLEDTDFNLQYFLTKNASLIYMNKKGYDLRIHENSTVHRYNSSLQDELLLPLEKMQKILKLNGQYKRDCQALAYRALLNTIVYIHDGVFNKQNLRPKTEQIAEFLNTGIIQDLFLKLDPNRLNFTEKLIVECSKHKAYWGIQLFYRAKSYIKKNK